MLPISKRDAAQFIRSLCRKHNVSPQAVIREIHDDGALLTDTVRLCYVSGVYYLHGQHTRKVGTYSVTIDTVVYASQLPRATALALAEKLCQLLFTAREIHVYKDTQLVLRWIRLPRTFNRWILKEEYYHG